MRISNDLQSANVKKHGKKKKNKHEKTRAERNQTITDFFSPLEIITSLQIRHICQKDSPMIDTYDQLDIRMKPGLADL